MKKDLKKFRDAQYYCFVIDKWCESIPSTKNVLKKSDIFNLLTQANVFFGLEDNKYTSYSVLEKLENMLGTYIEKTDDRISTLYSLKIDEKNKENTVSEIKSKIIEYFNLKYKNRKKVERKKEESGSLTCKKERKYSVKRSTIENCYRILNWMVENKKNSMERKEILKTLNCQNIQSSQVDSWLNTIERYNGTIIDLMYIATKGKRENKGFIKSNNPGNSLLLIIKLGNELYNMFPNTKFSNKPVYIKREQQGINLVKDEKISDHDLSKLIYSVAGIIFENSYRSVDVNDICSNLAKKFDIKITKKEIISALKESPEFDLIEHGDRIKLINNSSSWEKIVKEHGPKNFIKEVFVRLTFDLKTVQTYFSSAIIVSQISECDAIYKITYNESISDLINWIELYRKFRENDKILNDEELEQTINREIERINALAFSDSLRYKLEI